MRSSMCCVCVVARGKNLAGCVHNVNSLLTTLVARIDLHTKICPALTDGTSGLPTVLLPRYPHRRISSLAVGVARCGRGQTAAVAEWLKTSLLQRSTFSSQRQARRLCLGRRASPSADASPKVEPCDPPSATYCLLDAHELAMIDFCF